MNPDHPADDGKPFSDLVGGVRPLIHDRVVHQPPRPAPRPRQRERDERQVLVDMLSDAYDPADLETGEELWFARSGLQHGVLKKLRRGRYSIQAELDLHGMNVDTARRALAEFMRDANRAELRCVRIIHGKGKRSAQGIPILKDKLNRWLRQWDRVLAFSSARPVDGGSGAVYVLLKR